MSLQRVLEIARQRNMPVIVTDLAGREPMVVMPLQQFERMSESAPQKAGSGAPVPVTFRVAVESKPKANMDKEVHLESIAMQDFAQAPVENLEGSIRPENGLAVEERFYLEPVDEESA